MWEPIPNSSAPTVISIVISLGKQGTVSPLRSKPLRKKVTMGENERNVCVTQNLYACQKAYNLGCDRKKSQKFQLLFFLTIHHLTNAVMDVLITEHRDNWSGVLRQVPSELQ